MKKLLFIFFSILFITSCISQNNPDVDKKEQKKQLLNTKNSEEKVFLSISNLDGQVNNWFQADTTKDGTASENSIQVGKDSSIIFKNNKAIFTFDTSSLEEQTVENAFLAIKINNKNQLPQNWQQYLKAHLKLDFAGPYGFSGNQYLDSFKITGIDYWASSVKSFSLEYDNQKNGFIIPSEALEYIQLNRKTQIRISFKQNPQKYLIQLVKSDLSAPALKIKIKKITPVTIQYIGELPKGFFYVTMDYNSGLTRRQMGYEYMKQMLILFPDFEQMFSMMFMGMLNYNTLIERTKLLIPQIPEEYREEIEGMASAFTAGGVDSQYDYKISLNEIYYLHLIMDVNFFVECSALGVFKNRSQTGKSILGRVIDTHSAYAQTVYHIKNGRKSSVIIGTPITISHITVLNKKKMFGAILSSSVGGETFPADVATKPYNSYVFDLRYALENFNTIEDAANYMKNKNYTLNHLVFLGDQNNAKVLENNLTGSGFNMKRELRSYNSQLHDGVTWDFENAIAVVNSFLLEGNHNNHTGVDYNEKRWKQYKEQLALKGDKVNFNEVKEIMTYYEEDKPTYGSIYSTLTQTIIVYEPSNFHLEIFFRDPSVDQSTGQQVPPPLEPNFFTIPISFD